MTLKALIFDLDGTLGDTMPVVVAALQETFRRFGGREAPPEEIHSMFGPSEEGVIARQVPAEQYEPALRCYLERYEALHAAASQPFPGITALLGELRERGIRVGVVTGKGAHTAEISLRLMGLGPYIEKLSTGSDAGAIKPAAIRAMLVEWNILPEAAAYVGDMPYDMQAAREAGVCALAAGWAATATVQPGCGETAYFDSVAGLAAWARAQNLHA